MLAEKSKRGLQFHTLSVGVELEVLSLVDRDGMQQMQP